MSKIITVITFILLLANMNLYSDFEMYGWGDNSMGQIGIKSDENDQSIPNQLGDDGDWEQVSVSHDHALALKSDGTLWAWGKNNRGQLGDGTNIDRAKPVQIGTDNDWVAVSAGGEHSIALKMNGRLWAWGSNEFGQLGDATFEDKDVPVQISFENMWLSVSTGLSHTVAIRMDGTLWAWGNNIFGQIGDGTLVPKSIPTIVGFDNNWQAVFCGGVHTLGMQSDGTIWAWGNNEFGQLGDGTFEQKLVPTLISADNDWNQISSGGAHNLAMKNDGTIWAWGNNMFGQLGDGTFDNKNIPTFISADVDWDKIVAADTYSFALKMNNSLWSWGQNDMGQLGQGNYENLNIPTRVGIENNWENVSGGFAYSIGIKMNGTLWAWGEPFVEDNSNDIIELPTKIGVMENWLTVNTGGYHTLAINSDGQLWATGNNDEGQLGTGNYLQSSEFIQINSDVDWASVSSGEFHTLALKENGTLWAWGSNVTGQLGLGVFENTATPTQVEEDNDWLMVTAGGFHSLGIKNDGTLWAWGFNGSGQVGINGEEIIESPLQIENGTDWVQISAGKLHTLAIRADSTLWAWGSNEYGQLGNDSEDDSFTPIRIGSENNWVYVEAGADFSFAIREGGTLWAWGDNSRGQYGDGSTTSRKTPYQVNMDMNWASVSCGDYHTLAIKTDGTLWGWGDNTYNQLGVHSSELITEPTQITLNSDWLSVSTGNNHSFGIIGTIIEPQIPTVTTADVTSVTMNSAISGGNVLEDNGYEIIARGVCWSFNPEPTLDDNFTEDGVGLGEFTSELIDLEPNTTYYVRAYATNSEGTAFGEEINFTTLADEELPVVITTEITNITHNSAVSGGEVLSEGASAVLARGVCWSIEEMPTLDANFTIDDEGLGEFISNITDLQSNTTYYVRAYATNEQGTAYGNQLEFTTITAPNIIITTVAVTSITSNSAISGGIITEDGGSLITMRGVCWSIEEEPTLENEFTVDGAGMGEFVSNITGLESNTTYYVRAYATNNDGTTYGNQLQFTTSSTTIELPSIITVEVISYTENSAIVSGNVLNDGGAIVSAKGICWSENPEPTLEDSFTDEGIGIGVFISNITGLEANTTYYVRAYATNSAGTAYGSEMSFTTMGTRVIDRTNNTDMFLLHPNPSGDFLNINIIASEINNFSIEMYDLNGNYIPLHILEETAGTIKLDISSLAYGAYTLIMKHKEVLYSYKFIKN